MKLFKAFWLAVLSLMFFANAYVLGKDNVSWNQVQTVFTLRPIDFVTIVAELIIFIVTIAFGIEYGHK